MSTTLWLIDRSRISAGRGFCQRSRALNNHIGPHGYGIQLKGTALPLMTGTGAHEGLRPILEWCRDQLTSKEAVAEQLQTGQAVPNLVVRAAVQVAQTQYYQVVAARGFAYMADQPSIQEAVREQNYLIEGLIWAWVLEVLPEVLQRGRVLEVEHDQTYVFGCTCGLSDGVGTQQDHEARDCQGIGLMCKPDFILETWATQELEYHEFKTTGYDGPSFRDQWEIMIQMFAATLDAETRLGKPVSSIYVHGLLKGKRGRDYNPESKRYDLGPKKQGSLFCYGWKKPANPPMEPEEWAAQYEWWDDFEKKTKRLPKAYQKAGVWELPESLLPSDLEGGPPITRGEFWAKWIPPEARQKALILLGPFSRQSLMVPHFLEECLGEEDRWREGLWQLYLQGQDILSEAYPDLLDHPEIDLMQIWWEIVWPDDRFQTLLDRLFPRSYECRRFGEDSRCQFEDICFGREGWQNPLGSGRYIIRRPHHADELQQMQDRGLIAPEVGAAMEQEEVGE